MKKYTRDELIEISKNDSLLSREIKSSWGDIFTQLEKNEIFPDKKVLFGVRDACVFPFLFKNYSLSDEEYSSIKRMVNEHHNYKTLQNYTSKEITPEIVDNFIEVKEIEDTIESVDDADYSNYEVILDALKNRKTIPFLPSHNIELLEKLFKDGYDFSHYSDVDFDEEEYQDDPNVDWVKAVLVSSDNKSFDSMSDELAVKVFYHVREATPEDKDNIYFFRKSFLEKVFSKKERLNWYDVNEKSLPLVSPEIAYKAIASARMNEKLEDSKWSKKLKTNLSLELKKYIEEKLDVKKFKELTDNKYIALWDEDDFKKHKKEFLENAFYENRLMPNNEFLNKCPQGFENYFTQKDAIDFFNSLKKANGESFHSMEVNDNAVILLTHFLKLVYPNNEKINNEIVDIKKISTGILTTIGHSHVYDEGRIALVKLSLHMLNGSSLNDFKHAHDFFSMVSRDFSRYYFYDESKDAIKKYFSPENASLEKALLFVLEDLKFLGEDIRNNMIKELHPEDVKILKELGLDLPGNVKGNSKAVPTNRENSTIFSKDMTFSYSWGQLLTSKTYAETFKGDLSWISSKEDVQMLLHCVNRYNNSKRIISFIEEAMSKNSDLLPTNHESDEDYIKGLDRIEKLRKFTPPVEHLSYKRFMQECNAYVGCSIAEKTLREEAEKQPNYQYHRFIERADYRSLSEKKSTITDAIDSVPQDLKKSYIKKYVQNKDWNNYYLPYGESDNVIYAALDENLSITDVKALFAADPKTFTMRGNALAYINPQKMTQTQAFLVCEFLNRELNDNGYSLPYDNIKDLLEYKNSRKMLVQTMKEHYPDLLITPVIFNATQDFDDVERFELLKTSLKNASSEVKKWAVNKNPRDSKKLPEFKDVSTDLIKMIRQEQWTVEEKIVLQHTLTSQCNNIKFQPQEYLDLIKNAGVEVSDGRREFILTSPRFIENQKNSSAFIFPEFYNKDFWKENAKELLDFNNTYKFDFRMNYYLKLVDNDDPDSNKNFGHSIHYIGEKIDEVVKRMNFSINLDENFMVGYKAFLASNEEPENITQYTVLNDKNFVDVMSVLSGTSSFNVDNSSKAKFEISMRELINSGFTSHSLSDENKEILCNAIRITVLSEKCLDNSVFYGTGIEILKSPEVLDTSYKFMLHHKISNMFSDFDDKYLIDENEDSSNSFKL